jgi:hypothetical protein
VVLVVVVKEWGVVMAVAVKVGGAVGTVVVVVRVVTTKISSCK